MESFDFENRYEEENSNESAEHELSIDHAPVASTSSNTFEESKVNDLLHAVEGMTVKQVTKVLSKLPKDSTLSKAIETIAKKQQKSYGFNQHQNYVMTNFAKRKKVKSVLVLLLWHTRKNNVRIR